MLGELAASWNRRGHLVRGLALLIVAVLVALVVLLVYQTGGTRYVYAHSAYLPIVAGAFLFGWKGGLATALLLGLALGPLMPIEVATGEMQRLENWLLRCLFFAATGLLTGLLVDYLEREARRRTRAALTDELSGLPNRAALERRLATLTAEGAGGGTWWLAVVRLNNLPAIVELLDLTDSRRLWAALRERLARGDTAPELFNAYASQLAILVEGDLEAAEQFANGMVDRLSSPFEVGGLPLELDPSAGISFVRSADEINPHPVLTATAGARRANEEGRQLVVPRDVGQEKRRQALQRLGEIRDALEQRQLRFYVQPKVELKRYNIVGAEVLMRWQHPRDGLLPPGAFLPLVERTRLIHPVSWYSFDLACREAAEWWTSSQRLTLAVNLSARALMADDLVERLGEILAKYKFDPAFLEVEITESAIMATPDEACRKLDELRGLGLSIAIDDFGTGHSSLAYLANIPASTLKIDRSFVSSMLKSRRSRQIATAAVNLGQQLGMTTVAEGVEDEATLKAVRDAGFDQIQGYLIAKPMPTEAFVPWISENPYPLLDERLRLRARDSGENRG